MADVGCVSQTTIAVGWRPARTESAVRPCARRRSAAIAVPPRHPAARRTERVRSPENEERQSRVTVDQLRLNRVSASEWAVARRRRQLNDRKSEAAIMSD